MPATSTVNSYKYTEACMRYSVGHGSEARHSMPLIVTYVNDKGLFNSHHYSHFDFDSPDPEQLTCFVWAQNMIFHQHTKSEDVQSVWAHTMNDRYLDMVRVRWWKTVIVIKTALCFCVPPVPVGACAIIFTRQNRAEQGRTARNWRSRLVYILFQERVPLHKHA